MVKRKNWKKFFTNQIKNLASEFSKYKKYIYLIRRQQVVSSEKFLGHGGHRSATSAPPTRFWNKENVMNRNRMQWKKNGLLTLASICLIGMVAQEVAAQSNEDPPTGVVVETSVASSDNCAEGKPRTLIEVDALTGVEYTVKNVPDGCIEITNHTYNGKSEAPAVSPAITLDPFPVVEKVSKYDFGGGLFVSGLVLLQPRDDRDGYDESVEKMLVAGLVGTLNTPSWEWSANVGAGLCGNEEVAATAGAALLHKQGEHFGLGPTVNLSFCSNTTDPDEELVQLRVVDAGLRLAGNWEHFGMFADVVGAISTEPMFIGRSTEFGLGVRLGVRTGWF